MTDSAVRPLPPDEHPRPFARRRRPALKLLRDETIRPERSGLSLLDDSSPQHRQWLTELLYAGAAPPRTLVDVFASTVARWPQHTALEGAERSLTFFEQVAKKSEGLPGVRHATFARRMLLTDSGGGAVQHVSIPGVELPQGQVTTPIKFNVVGPDYFETLGTRLVRGREFTPTDGPAGARVVLISQTMARRFWSGKDPLSRHIVAEGKECQIVGVVEDAKINGIHEAPEPYMYFPFAQAPIDWGTLIVETTGDRRTQQAQQAQQAMVAAIRSEIRSVDPKVGASVHTSRYLMQQAFWQDQTAAGSVGALGLLGMFLAAVGLYGVIAYLVNRRSHEIGIRLALGAERRDVLRLVLSQGLRLAAIGTGVGLVVSLAVTRLMSDLLYGVKPWDPLTLAFSSAVVFLVALAACYIPARRATKVDPMVALRYE